jgi:N-acetylglutamate synthase-like GNAT family acetyltransferase
VTVAKTTAGVLRPARAEEAQALSQLALRSKAHWGYSQEFIDACRDELSYSAADILSPHMEFVVLEAAGVYVGFYALQRLSQTDIELDALFVTPTCIGRGFGRRLLEDAQRAAAKRGAIRLTIQGDPNAEQFYLAAGARRTGATESASVPGRLLPTFVIDLASFARG